ncbi:MAG: HEPN domain-containing protein [Gammaproteobacteria bacterium]|nr:HEPN domain-containing protein [Gammaproteobacteria bacterium]
MKDTERLFSDGIFGFHAQQAIEKALKAWLCHLGKEYPKTHDIRLLLMLLSSSGEKIDSYWPLVEYNIYAVQSRYEYIAENEPFKRPQVIQQIERLLNKIKKIISN